jgi:hypothetical protein
VPRKDTVHEQLKGYIVNMHQFKWQEYLMGASLLLLLLIIKHLGKWPGAHTLHGPSTLPQPGAPSRASTPTCQWAGLQPSRTCQALHLRMQSQAKGAPDRRKALHCCRQAPPPPQVDAPAGPHHRMHRKPRRPARSPPVV